MSEEHDQHRLQFDLLCGAASIDAMTPHDEVCAFWIRAQAVKAKAVDVFNEAKSSVEEWIGTNGDMQIGDIRYYLGIDRDHRLKKTNDETFVAMLEIFSTEQFSQCLASGWLKPGQLRAHLIEAGRPEMFDELFERVERVDMKTGKPKKSIQAADPRFCGSKVTK